jgi:hypothetical protein
MALANPSNHTQEADIIRWTLFLGLCAIVAAYLFGGHIHAKRRIRKGLPPYAYHRVSLS